MRQRVLSLIASLAVILPPAAEARKLSDPKCAAARTTISSARVDAARGALRRAVNRGFAPGAVMLVEHRGRVVLREVVGLADVQRRMPMQADSLFRLYSMTKPVTTLAALQLVDQGRLSLDDPVAKYLPAFAETPVFVFGDDQKTLKVEPQLRPLTVRDLMRHTAGMTYKADGPTVVQRLYAVRGIDTGSGADIAPLDGSPRVASSAELTERLAGIPLLHQPGTKFSYGNATDVLGRVVEVVSRQRLSDYMEHRIFKPLGMEQTHFTVPARDALRLTAAYAGPSQVPQNAAMFARVDPAATAPGKLTLADDPAKSPYLSARPIDYGGAGLVGTASDYLRFTQAVRQGGALGRSRILSPGLAAEMVRNQLPANARTEQLVDSGLGFGLGLAVRDTSGLLPSAFPRCGSFWGGAASTFFWIDPANEISGVLMTQVFGGDMRSVWLSVLDSLYGSKPAP